MIIDSRKAEEAAVINLAYGVCAAARTAPKACGKDNIDTAILTGEDKDRLADEMRRLGESFGPGGKTFIRDAGNVDASGAVVLVGAKNSARGLAAKCKLCGFGDCESAAQAGAPCAFTAMDLGIALGSAVALAADNRADNRLMFTIGQAAARLGMLGEYNMIIGIPLAVTGKSPFYDRK